MKEENNIREKESEPKRKEKFSNILKIIKNIISWIIGIFFILSFIIYVSEIPIPAICILLAGILLLPPIRRRINEKFEKNNHNLKALEIIAVIILFIIFCVNVPQNDTSTDQTKLPTTGSDSISQNDIKIDEVVTNEVKLSNGTYKGDIKNNKKDGNGTFEWNDGSKYEGQWKDDQINGNGTLTIEGKGTYTGNFKNGKKDGKGKFTFTNGDVYEGDFVEDKMEGNGSYSFVNGDKYVGEFSDNKFNGNGTYTLKDGKEYNGQWENNEYKK